MLGGKTNFKKNYARAVILNCERQRVQNSGTQHFSGLTPHFSGPQLFSGPMKLDVKAVYIVNLVC
jgi:hypothetical protein